jgi:Ca-activated chloride channel family protein
MKRIIFSLLIMAIGAAAVHADGIIIPRPQPWMPPNPAVNIKYHYVDVEINDPVALTKIDQVFVNPFSREIEADYIFPVPEDAAISRFVAWLGGHKMEAELLDAAQARRIYEDIVRRRRDPALLEYAGQGMYRLRIYPIPASGDVRIQIEYEQTLKSENGTVEYAYPLNTEKHSGSNLEECRVEVSVSSFDNLGSFYCPTHHVTVERTGDKSFRAKYNEKNVKPDKDIIFYFTRQKSDFGFQLLSYREPGRGKGFFLGILSPPLWGRQEKVNKNVIFLLDSSGSMRGEKMRQAIDALKFCLQGLNDGDRFNIIDYDDTVRPFRQGLVSAAKAAVDDAISFADLIEASGGTNIYDALASACRMIPRSGDPTYIIFLTDGLPTVGNTDIQQIIGNTTALNEGRARLFAFGVGFDVNTQLLDKLSQQNHGLPEYVLPSEDIEVKVSRLASKISHPALTDLALSFNPKQVYDVYPSPVPDLFYGSEIIFTGRFDENGPSHAVLAGKIGGKDVRYEFPVVFGDGSGRQEFIPLLWANRRIGYLLQEMRLHGTNDELLSEVIELSKKYGIITEYTSFLVTGDERSRRENIALDSRTISRERKSAISSYMAPQAGESAVTQSFGLQKQTQADQVAPSGVANIGGVEQRFTNITQVGAQAFFQVGNNWIQGDLTGDKFDMQIKRFSQAYFQLLDKAPSLGRYLGLGNEVRLQIGTQVVQVSDTGKETLSEKEMHLLFP